MEGAFFSPAYKALQFVGTAPYESVVGLATEPDGAAIHYPIVGGRRYLFDQIFHGKPLAATLNFPMNPPARRLWKSIYNAEEAHINVCSNIATVARKEGIRYLIVHQDIEARPDIYHRVVDTIINKCEVLEGSGAKVVKLW